MNNLMKKKVNALTKGKKKGFTLVELIIVIAIIAILAAIAIPKFGQITKNANIKADVATAKTIHEAAAELVAENPSAGTASDFSTKVAAKLDNGIPTPKAVSGAFKITYDTTDGDIVISAGATGSEKQVYPSLDSTYGN